MGSSRPKSGWAWDEELGLWFFVLPGDDGGVQFRAAGADGVGPEAGEIVYLAPDQESAFTLRRLGGSPQRNRSPVGDRMARSPGHVAKEPSSIQSPSPVGIGNFQGGDFEEKHFHTSKEPSEAADIDAHDADMMASAGSLSALPDGTRRKSGLAKSSSKKSRGSSSIGAVLDNLDGQTLGDSTDNMGDFEEEEEESDYSAFEYSAPTAARDGCVLAADGRKGAMKTGGASKWALPTDNGDGDAGANESPRKAACKTTPKEGSAKKKVGQAKGKSAAGAKKKAKAKSAKAKTTPGKKKVSKESEATAAAAAEPSQPSAAVSPKSPKTAKAKAKGKTKSKAKSKVKTKAKAKK